MSLCRLFSVNLYMRVIYPLSRLTTPTHDFIFQIPAIYILFLFFFFDVIGTCKRLHLQFISTFYLHLFYFYSNFITSPLICNFISEFVEFATLLLKLLRSSSSFVVYDFLLQQTMYYSKYENCTNMSSPQKCVSFPLLLISPVTGNDSVSCINNTRESE